MSFVPPVRLASFFEQSHQTTQPLAEDRSPCNHRYHGRPTPDAAMNNSDTFPGASTPHPGSSSASSKTNTISIGPNRRYTNQDSTSPYDSDMDLAVHGLHIVDSSHLYPGYKPRQRNAAPHYFHQGSADKMSSSSSSTTTPSPPRPQYRLPLSSMNNSSDSDSFSSPSEKVSRKWGVRSYPSLKQRVREERDVRDVRRFPGAKGGRMENARLQVGTGYNDEDGDVEMVDMDVSSGSGSHNWKDAREFERGYDGDTEMVDVPPLSPPPSSSSHEVKGASCSGSNGSKGGFHGRRKGSEMPVKLQTEGGNTDKSTTSTGSKKRARGSDQMDEEGEEKVEHKRMRSSCESRQ